MTNLEATGLGLRTAQCAVKMSPLVPLWATVVSGTAVHINTFPLLQCNTQLDYNIHRAVPRPGGPGAPGQHPGGPGYPGYPGGPGYPGYPGG